MSYGPLIRAGAFLGVGLGGFLDGILLHQIFQVHNMLSNKLPPDTPANVQINMFWDGLFHAFTWVTTLVGITLLWKAAPLTVKPQAKKIFVSAMIFGWGLFNLVEGIIDHQILEVHHVIQRARGPERFYYDMAFLVFGALQIVLGRISIRRLRNRDLA